MAPGQIPILFFLLRAHVSELRTNLHRAQHPHFFGVYVPPALAYHSAVDQDSAMHVEYITIHMLVVHEFKLCETLHAMKRKICNAVTSIAEWKEMDHAAF